MYEEEDEEEVSFHFALLLHFPLPKISIILGSGVQVALITFLDFNQLFHFINTLKKYAQQQQLLRRVLRIAIDADRRRFDDDLSPVAGGARTQLLPRPDHDGTGRQQLHPHAVSGTRNKHTFLRGKKKSKNLSEIW